MEARYLKKSANRREEVLATALCQALILKKEVCADRFPLPGMTEVPVQCPENCHACCKATVILDLTAVESLTIYLLNRELIGLVEKHIGLQEDKGYCPFLIKDKCIIHTYKPTACQMYMPVAHAGRPLCYYLAREQHLPADDHGYEYLMNSSCYAIHGFMLMMQGETDGCLPHSYFMNIHEGTLWWKNNYPSLPKNTRIILESILRGDPAGLQLQQHFKYTKALQAGYQAYVERLEHHCGSIANQIPT